MGEAVGEAAGVGEGVGLGVGVAVAVGVGDGVALPVGIGLAAEEERNATRRSLAGTNNIPSATANPVSIPALCSSVGGIAAPG